MSLARIEARGAFWREALATARGRRAATSPLQDIRASAWPLASLGEAMRIVSSRLGCTATDEPLAMPQDVATAGGEDLQRWLDWAAAGLGMEAETVSCPIPDIEGLLRSGAPAIIPFQHAGESGFLTLLGARRGRPQVLGADLSVRTCDADDLARFLSATRQAPVMQEVERVLDAAGLTGSRRERASTYLARDRLRFSAIDGLMLFRRAASAEIVQHVKAAAIPARIGSLVALTAFGYALEILGWALIGGAALGGRLDRGWLVAWTLVVLTAIPVRCGASFLSSTTALRLATILKTRLFLGSLRSDMDGIRASGVGRLLARVMDSQAFESLVIGGGLSGLLAIVELLAAFAVICSGAGGLMQAGLLALWCIVTIVLVRRYRGRMSHWTSTREQMTHELVERMTGHRTVLAQDHAIDRDQREDVGTLAYFAASQGLDKSSAPLALAASAGWTIVGLAGLAPAFIAGTAEPVSLAIGVGGVMFAARALAALTSSGVALIGAGVTWSRIAPILAAAGAKGARGPFTPIERRHQASIAAPVLDAENLEFGFSSRTRPVLRDASLAISQGDRILIQGPSGGGKSTFAALLSGLRAPSAGLLFLNGLDRQTLGDSWNDFVAQAPQFHENHIFTGSLAFNLLMGRRWPANSADLVEAEEICVELGLGDLLARMPGGLMQIVGETGWQLSHGERSRIFLARAILQNAAVTILDESFAALDPQTLERCVACAFRRAQTLVVIAHP